MHHHNSLHGGSMGKQQQSQLQGIVGQQNEAVKTELRKMVYEYLATEGMTETFFKMQVKNSLIDIDVE